MVEKLVKSLGREEVGIVRVCAVKAVENLCELVDSDELPPAALELDLVGT